MENAFSMYRQWETLDTRRSPMFNADAQSRAPWIKRLYIKVEKSAIGIACDCKFAITKI